MSFCLIGEECDEMTHKDNIKCSDFTDENDLDEISELGGMRSDSGRIFPRQYSFIEKTPEKNYKMTVP